MPLLRRRDLAASLLVAVLVGVYLVFLAASNFLGAHGMACVTLMVSGTIFLLFAADQQPDAAGWLTTILAVTAFASGVLALAVRPSTLLLTIAIGTSLAVYSIQVAEQITFTSPTPREANNDDDTMI